LKLSELREYYKISPINLNSMAQTNKFIITEEIKRRLNDPDYLKRYVDGLFKAVDSGNVSAIQEINNRVEGKVKETIDLTTSIKSLQPTQEEQQVLDDRFRIKPISIKADSIKTLPEPFNAEQLSVNIEGTTEIPQIQYINTPDNTVNTPDNIPLKKPDTFPVDCTLNSNTDTAQANSQIDNVVNVDNNAEQDTDNWYDKTLHFKYRNT
jgi:hypothetical protein